MFTHCASFFELYIYIIILWSTRFNIYDWVLNLKICRLCVDEGLHTVWPLGNIFLCLFVYCLRINQTSQCSHIPMFCRKCGGGSPVTSSEEVVSSSQRESVPWSAVLPRGVSVLSLAVSRVMPLSLFLLDTLTYLSIRHAVA